MSQPKVTVFKRDTNLRLGGSTRGPNNIVTVIQPGLYTAFEQCAGEEVTEGDDSNFWWVKIDTGTEQGWVSAVRIKEGGNDQPIPGVREMPTVFCDDSTSAGG